VLEGSLDVRVGREWRMLGAGESPTYQCRLATPPRWPFARQPRVNETAQIIGLGRLVPTTIRKSPPSRSRSDWRYQR
jgi:hypothetical protein